MKTPIAGGALIAAMLTLSARASDGQLKDPSLPESCPVEPGMTAQAMTLPVLDYLARKGVLYFNLHTKAHTFYGEMRGQIYPMKE